MSIKLKDLYIYGRCPHLMKILKKKHKVYFELKNKLYILINFFFYKKLRGDEINLNKIEKRWHRIVPEEFKRSRYKKLFFSYFKKVFNFYNEKKLDIICVSDPINFGAFSINIHGCMDLITREKDHYNIYLFYFDVPNLKGIPGIITNCFKNEFKEHKFNLILHDILKENTKVIYLSRNPGKHIKESLNIISKISLGDKNCKNCKFKRSCKYYEKN